jgi:hypothetical protein
MQVLTQALNRKFRLFGLSLGNAVPTAGDEDREQQPQAETFQDAAEELD